jgi:dipeptidyl aminopeptidase/acylaminoacyl peptidase
MNRIRNLISALLGLLALAGLAAGLSWLFRSQGVWPGQQVSPVRTVPPISPVQTPTPATLPTLTPYVPETLPPVPTPLPTPLITPIPVANPPFIPGLEGAVPEPFHIILREGNAVWMVNSDGSGRRLLIDTEDKAGLYLGHHPMSGIDAPAVRWGTVSPDGTRLALVVTDLWEVEYKEQPFGWQIYLFDIQTSEFRFLVEGREPVWSLDGTRIAYAGSGIGPWNSGGGLWVVDVESGAAREIFPVAEEHWVRNIVWSPGGWQIALLYSEAGLGAPVGALIINSDGRGEAIPLLSSTSIGGWAFDFLCWSRDGRTILYVSGAGEHTDPETPFNLWAISIEGHQQTQLTTDISIAGKALSPDGAWIAFAGTRFYETESYPYDLWLIHSDGGELYRLTDDPVSDLSPKWSPDGTHIVFRRGEEGIWTLNLIDGTLSQIFPDSVNFVVTR